MTDDELREIEARANAAAAGPWYARGWARGPNAEHIGNKNWWRIDSPQIGCLAELRGPDTSAQLVVENDAAFIAHARTDVPAICSALREAWAEQDADAARHMRYFDAIGEAIGPDRERRHTGEPSLSDAQEIARLRRRAVAAERELDSMRSALEALKAEMLRRPM